MEIVSGASSLPPHKPDNGWTLALIPAFSPKEKGKRSQRFGELKMVGSANDIFGGTPKITRGTRVLQSTALETKKRGWLSPSAL